MKRPIYALILAVLFAACESKKEPTTTTISGQITNPKGDVVTFRVDDEGLTDTLDAENKFSYSFDIDEPQEVRFGHGGEITYIYLRPGDDLFLTLDTEEFDESLRYTGIGSEINNYKAALVLMGDTLLNQRELFSLPPDSFLLAIQTEQDMKLSAMQSFNITDQTFKNNLKGNALWRKRLLLLEYEPSHKYYVKLDSFSVSEGFYDFKNEVDMNDSTQLKYAYFKHYVQAEIKREASENYNKRQNKEESNYNFLIGAMDKLTSLEPIKETMIYDILKWDYLDLTEDQRKEYTAKWLSYNPEQDKIDEIKQEVLQIEKILPGKPAPSFNYASLEGDTVSLEDLHGKVVYIDVWATWCGPCIREHPFMEKLQQRFEGKDVVFIAVDTDSSPEPWRKMVAEKELGGIHVYAPGAWEAKIMKDYAIHGIPRFILIDQEGNIVDADAARPSGDIGDQIEELLKSA